MNKFVSCLFLILVYASTSFAQTSNTLGADGAVAGQVANQNIKNPSMFEAMLQMLPLCIIIYFIFYFFVTRPEEQVRKKRNEMIKNLTRGDNVRTSCGILGRVSSIEEDFISLEISQGVKVKFSKDAIVEKI